MIQFSGHATSYREFWSIIVALYGFASGLVQGQKKHNSDIDEGRLIVSEGIPGIISDRIISDKMLCEQWKQRLSN